MAIENRNLPTGTRLVANYKKQTYVCTVETDPEGEGRSAFVLEDGSRFKSPSAAGSHIMGGKAVNGWRFWTVEGDEPPATERPAKPSGAKKGRKSSKTVFRVPNQQGVGEGKSRWFCSACMKGFIAETTGDQEQCPEGHRNDDPELNAPAGVTADAEVPA